MSLVTLNSGSSSIKFALYDDDGRARRLRGAVSGIGKTAKLSLTRADQETTEETLGELSHEQALEYALDRVHDEAGRQMRAIGHRIVHGGAAFTQAVRIEDGVEDRLRALIPLAPTHQPHNLAGIESARARFPGALQTASFDTAFHRAQPIVADTYALPRRYYDEGIRRYGFHGLSYDYLSHRVCELEGERRTVIAHLGSGASMCAVKGRAPLGSTMGLTALDRLPMSTRCGQIDPGAVLHLIGHEGLDAGDASELLYKQSGLKGLSGGIDDMRELEESGTAEAQETLAYFVRRCRMEIAALASTLEGLDTLVFSAGIGENSAFIRREICAGLSWLGVELDAEANTGAGRETRISAEGSPAAVWVIPTDEESVIARDVAGLIG